MRGRNNGDNKLEKAYLLNRFTPPFSLGLCLGPSFPLYLHLVSIPFEGVGTVEMTRKTRGKLKIERVSVCVCVRKSEGQLYRVIQRDGHTCTG